MVSRNLPPSFFNANYHMKGVYGGDIYSDYPSSLHHLAAHGATTDPWQYAQVIHLYTVKKRLPIFPSPAGMSLTKLPLAGKHKIIPGQEEFG
jgi:hypothetical protein